MPRIELIGGPRAGTEGNRRVIREAFAAHGGDEVDAQGDSFLDVFGARRTPRSRPRKRSGR
jgi:hypothetical protein